MYSRDGALRPDEYYFLEVVMWVLACFLRQKKTAFFEKVI